VEADIPSPKFSYPAVHVPSGQPQSYGNPYSTAQPTSVPEQRSSHFDNPYGEAPRRPEQRPQILKSLPKERERRLPSGASQKDSCVVQ